MIQSELQNAMGLDRNMFIEASAGTGKTFTLTKRYCAILDDFARQALENPDEPRNDPSNILVITFTRKAANEMTVKIFKDLRELLAGRTIDESLPELGHYLQQCSQDYRLWLEGAFSRHSISTIDSFCMQVLKDHAFTAGLDPDFKVEEEVRSGLFFEKQLDLFLRKKASESDPALSAVFDLMPASQVKSVIRYLYEHRLFLQDWFETMERKRKSLSGKALEDELWHGWVQAYTPDFNAEAVLAELNHITDYLSGPVDDDKDNGIIFLQQLRDGLDSLSPGLSGVWLRRELCEKVLPLLMTKSGTFRRSFPGDKKRWHNPKILVNIKNRLAELMASLEIEDWQVTGAPNNLDRQGLSILIHIHALFVVFQEQMLHFQERMGYLTFDDVILKTRTLLIQHETIRKNLSDRYVHILVDEFQDTNDPRWDIIRMIASDDTGTLRPSGLFIVGDKKQSIYGFQQADVTVMNRAKNDLKKTTILPEEIVLRNNYRSSEQFIERVINVVFPRLFQAPETAWQAKFSATRPGDKYPPVFTRHPQYPILIRTVTDIPKMDRQTAGAVNAALTARDMLAWWNRDGMEDKLKHANVKHEGPVIGILLRSFTRVGAYAAVFKRFNIPLEIIAGNSFFQRQEIFDFCHLLSFFANPHDDLALVSLARSPWLMLTDIRVDAFRDRHKDKKESVWSFIRRTESFLDVATVLDDWLRRARSGFLPDVLEQMLAEKERELAYLSEPEGERSLANVDLAVHLLRGLMNNGLSLRESLAWFTSQRDQKSNREEAGSDGEARVCLMTIHKAKGLEFPMVIIGDMNRKGGNKTRSVAHTVRESDTDVVINIYDDDDENLRSGVLKSIHREQKDQEEAEELRIFYVAVTRAMFQVAFLGEFSDSDKRTGKNTPWYRYVGKGVLDERPADPMDQNWVNEDFPVEGLSISNRSWNDLQAEIPVVTTEEKAWVPPVYGDMGNKPLYQLTPHDIMDRIRPEEAGYRREGNTSEENRQYGIFFHKVMEEQWWDSMASAVAWLEKNKTDFFHLTLSGAKKRLEDDLTRMKSYALFTSLNQNSVRDAFYELSVSAWYESEQERFHLRGVIDLLYREGDTWTILDYKTDHDLSSLSQYMIQMNLYQEMVYQSFGIEARGILWFVSLNHHETVMRNPAVINHLSREGLPVKPAPVKGKAAPALMDELVGFLEENSTVVLCTTKTEAEEIRKYLVWRKLARPDIRILAWQDLLRVRNVPGRGLDPAVLILLCRYLLKENTDISQTPGTARKLAEAFSQTEMYRTEPDPLGDKLIRSVLKAIHERDLTTDGDIIRWLMDNHPFKGMDFFLTGWYQPSPLRHEFMTILARDARRFRMPGSEIIPDTDAWKRNETVSSGDHKVIVCNRSEDEVRTLFREIISQKNRDLQSCHIAVSNPSEYEPLIRRVAGEYGIPVSFSTRIPLKQTSAGRWLLNLITLIENSHRAEWFMIADVILDPLVQPCDALYELDIFIRRNALETPDAIRNFPDIETLKYRETFDQYVDDELQRITSLNTFSHCLTYLEKSLGNIRKKSTSSESIEDFDLKVMDKLEEFLHKSAPSLRLVGVHERDMKQEGLLLLKEWINGEEISRPDRIHGIPVTGFLDTMNLEPDCLWLLGLNQTDFPVRMQRNPFLSEIPYNPWYLNRRMLSHWCRLKHVYFLASKTLSNGTATEPSALLEAFEKKTSVPDRGEYNSRREWYRSYTYAFIKTSLNVPALVRHNALMRQKTDLKTFIDEPAGPYHGLTRPVSLPHKASATSIEQLIGCPMRYWFGQMLRLERTDADKEGKENQAVGGFVHAILCRFGREGGFKLNEDQALSLMKNIVEDELKNRDSDPETDIWSKQRFRFLIRGLYQNPPSGKMAALIRKNLEIVQSLSAVEPFYEQSFDDPDPDKKPEKDKTDFWPVLHHKAFPDLILNGKIDKLFVDHDGKRILISDYKTGTSYKENDIIHGYNIQPLVYYLKVKQQFPEYRTIFVYESIPKNHKAYEMSKEVGDAGENGLFEQTRNPLRIEEGNRTDEKSLLLQDIFTWFAEAVEHLKAGTFPHTSPDRYEKVCKFCDFEFMCRKPGTG